MRGSSTKTISSLPLSFSSLLSISFAIFLIWLLTKDDLFGTGGLTFSKAGDAVITVGDGVGDTVALALITVAAVGVGEVDGRGSVFAVILSSLLSINLIVALDGRSSCCCNSVNTSYFFCTK